MEPVCQPLSRTASSGEIQMTGERALVAVISILWVTAALAVIPAVFLLGYAIVTNEDIPDLWQQIMRQVVQALWFAVPAHFLARGSRVARWFAVFSSLLGLAAALIFAIGLIEGGAPVDLASLLAVPFVLAFLFSTWALLFHRGLQEALAQRLEKWKAAEKARLQELEDSMGEASEK
jgi:hypothetical protein